MLENVLGMDNTLFRLMWTLEPDQEECNERSPVNVNGEPESFKLAGADGNKDDVVQEDRLVWIVIVNEDKIVECRDRLCDVCEIGRDCPSELSSLGRKQGQHLLVACGT